MLTFSPELAATLAACADKIAWSEALISALGSSRTVTCKRAADATDPWANGTTFFSASVTGTMAVSNGAVTNFGLVSNATTKAAANLATGASVIRIAGGGHWVQGTLGLTGSGADIRLRASPTSTSGFGFASTCRVKAPPALPLGGAVVPPYDGSRYYTDGPFLFDAPPLGVVPDGANPLRYITPARSSVASPKSDYQWGNCGPTSTRIAGSWQWETVGGDFVNAVGTPQATTSPYFSWAANAVTSGSHTYSVDVTSAMQAVRAGNRYNAWFLRATASTMRNVATNYHASPPYIDVVYSDASTARLACRIGAYIDGSSAFGRAGASTANIGYGDKAAFEFERPTKSVSSATLVVTVDNHSAIASTISAFLANPTMNTNPVLTGIAAGYELDAGIEAHPSVIMVHRPVDAAVLGDHFRTNIPDYERRDSWSPHLFDHTQSPDITKLPYVGDGKFAGGGNVSIVPSTYTGDGFTKLADGLGAFRVLIPGVDIADGGATGYSGAHGVTAMAFLPEEHCGLLGEVYVRFYLYLAPAQADDLADMRMYRTEAVQPAEYAVHGGKFGLGASHWTPFGGNSGTGGGPRGWTNRFAWQEAPGDVSAVNSIRAGIHSWDMLGYDMMFGQQGGLGMEFYPGHWYCVETRLKLNTVDLVSDTPQAANPALNQSDAEIEAWIDGRRIMLRVGFSYRTLPLPAVDTGDVRTPPIRRLGIREVTFNDFQGGLLPSLTDRIKFYSNLVVSTEYIGPMKFPGPSLPEWLGARYAIATVPEANTFASINPGDSPAGGYTYAGNGTAFPMSLGWATIINAFSGGVYNPYYQHTPGTLGCMVFHGGGHSATNWNGVVIFDFNSLRYYIVCPGSLACYPGDSATTEYPDGQPASPHTYDTLAIIGPEAGYPQGALITVYRGGAWVENQYRSASVHVFDFANQGAKWQRLYSAGAAGWTDAFDIGHTTAYDPDLGRIWWVGQGNEVGYTPYFDLSDNTQKKATITTPLTKGPPNSNPDSKTMRYHSGRKLNVLADIVSYGDSTRRIYYHRTDAPAGGWTRATLSTPLPTGVSFGFDWVPSLGAFLCFCGSDLSNMYTLTMPAVLTDPWTVAAVPIVSGAFESSYVIGKRFAYSDAIGGIVYKSLAANAIKVYRP